MSFLSHRPPIRRYANDAGHVQNMIAQLHSEP